ncbi:MAG: hypothetical protein Q9219_004362 [cf. Caloplaca sp. 3 TL-2023]
MADISQRHQLFVIARINGRYRQLCAVHHYWLFGYTAVKRCRDTIRIFENPTNRLPIQQELTFAAKHHDDFWVCPVDQNQSKRTVAKNNNVPFPFIMTCLVLGASFSLEEASCNKASVEPFYMAFNEGDNSSGITIFDITDLNNVRYCFVDFNGKIPSLVDLMAPLSARIYLDAYHVLDNIDGSLLLESFEGKHLVTTTALIETWPQGEWATMLFISKETIDESRPPVSAAAAAAAPGGSSEMAEPHQRGAEVCVDTTKSLRDQSMDSMLDMLLDDPVGHADFIAEAGIWADFIPKLRQKFYARAATLAISEPLFDLLHKALEQDTEVDLAPFSTLTVQELSELVPRLGYGKMRTLNLSGRQDLTESDLLSILGITEFEENTEIYPPLIAQGYLKGNPQAIVLLGMPNISIRFLTKYLGQYEVYHTQLFRHPFFNEIDYGSPDGFPTYALQFAAPNTVAQICWVGIAKNQIDNPRFQLEDGRYDWNSLVFSWKATGMDPWGYNQVLKYRNYIIEVPSPPAKMVHALQRLIQYIEYSRSSQVQDWGDVAVECLATTSTLEHGTGYSVGPLSKLLSLNCKPRVPPELENTYLLEDQSLDPGTWVIVLIHENYDVYDHLQYPEQQDLPLSKPVQRLRFAFAKALTDVGSGRTRFLVTDVAGYVKHVFRERCDDDAEANRVINWWNEKSLSFREGTEFYAEDDIYLILNKTYPDELSRRWAPKVPGKMSGRWNPPGQVASQGSRGLF